MGTAELLNLNDSKELITTLTDSKKLSCLVAGISDMSRPEQVLMVGRLVEASRKYQLLHQFGMEVQNLIRKGALKDDFVQAPRDHDALNELLKFIDHDVPDEERFNAIKSIFFVSVSKQASEMDKILAYEFLKICQQLNSGEILVLKAIYDVYRNNCVEGLVIKKDAMGHFVHWCNLIAKQMGHEMPSLVELHEKKLADLKLITGRKRGDNFAVDPKNYRLSDTGIKFCEFITKGTT